MAELQSIAEDLYAVPLDEFIAMRDEQYEQARDGGDKALAAAIKKLRKPHAAAWALNVMCRERAELVDDVIELGQDLRDAQEAGDGSTIRRLDLSRRELMKKVHREASFVANQKGLSLSAAASDGLEQTLWAAMLDPEAADAVLTGLLVVPITAGMETEDLDEVVALAAPSAPKKTPPRAKAERKKAVSAKDVQDAAENVTATKEAAADADKRVSELARKRKRLGSRLDKLEDERDELRDQLRSVESDIDDAEKDIKELDHESRTAATAADRAHKDLDRAAAHQDSLDDA